MEEAREYSVVSLRSLPVAALCLLAFPSGFASAQEWPRWDEAAAAFSGYFAISPRYRPNCDWGDLPVAVATSSFADQPFDPDAHQYPRIGLTEPWFSPDEQWAIVSYHWSHVPEAGLQDTCIYHRQDDGWQVAQCLWHPL